MFFAMPVDDRHGIACSAENSAVRADIVGHEPVASLALSLGARIRQDILGLGGESDDECRA